MLTNGTELIQVQALLGSFSLSLIWILNLAQEVHLWPFSIVAYIYL